MPSVSRRQHNLMAMVAHDPAAAKRVGIPQSVGEEFVQADKGKKFVKGGPETRTDRQTVNQPKTSHGKSALFAKGGHVMATKKSSGGITNAKMGSVRTAAPSRDGLASKGKTKGKQVKMSPMGKDRKSTRLNSSHSQQSRMPSSA